MEKYEIQVPPSWWLLWEPSPDMGRQKRKKCINCNKLQNTFINTSLAYFLPESTNLFLHIFKHSYWHICDIFITCLMVSSECLKCLLSKLYRDEAATFPDISNKTILVLVKSSPCWCSWTSVSSRKYHGMLSSKYVLLPALISFSSGDLLHSASNPFERRDRREETFAQSLISLDIKVDDISLACFWVFEKCFALKISCLVREQWTFISASWLKC